MKLAFYILRRLFLMLIVMLGVATIVFFITHVIPADPVGAILGGNAPLETVDKLRHQLGLDQSLHVQYFRYLGGIFHGDFGVSIVSNHKVVDDILEFFPATVELACAAMCFTVLFGVFLGTVSAIKRNRPIDHILRVFSILGVSMPGFWLGLLLLLLFYFKLGWLPGTGRNDLFAFVDNITGLVLVDSIITRNWAGLWDAVKHIILPAFVLGYASAASVARIMRASMLDVLRQDYIRTARSKGLGRRVVIFRHALKNAMIPAVTVIGISFGDLLSGAVLTETIFSWPGLGRYIVQSLLVLDYPAITGATLFVAFIFSMANLVVDISYAALDPRMRL
ncbi:MAG TPA: ABC transporter permease [Holophaga sp.]|nr:ABC transporter permease [Holophaga sp.]HPS66840.1 ABC transporter permease [Holophaga sp.]